MINPWTRTHRTDILVPASEFAARAKAAGCPIYAFARISDIHCIIIYIRNNDLLQIKGIISELIPFKSDLYHDILQSQIVRVEHVV